jgi:hypothetical protein
LKHIVWEKKHHKNNFEVLKEKKEYPIFVHTNEFFLYSYVN